MRRELAIKIIITVLKLMLPSLESKAKESNNPIDDTLVAVIGVLITAYEAGELKLE